MHSLRAGDRWPRKLGDAVTACGMFVLIWSAHAAGSDFVELEWTIAVAAKRQICIVAVDGQALPATLTPYQVRRTLEPDVALKWLTGSFTVQEHCSRRCRTHPPNASRRIHNKTVSIDRSANARVHPAGLECRRFGVSGWGRRECIHR